MIHTIPVVSGDCKNDADVFNAGLRDFYDEVPELVVVDQEDFLSLCDDFSEIDVPASEIPAVCTWLANGKVFAAFRPVVVEDEAGVRLRLTK